MKTYDFKNMKISNELQQINDIYTQEKIKKNTIIIDSKNNENKILENYCNSKNYQATFIKKDFCFCIFLKVFRLYKENNINLDFNKIMHYQAFIENNGKQIKDYDFKGDGIRQLYNLFLMIKNNK